MDPKRFACWLAIAMILAEILHPEEFPPLKLESRYYFAS